MPTRVRIEVQRAGDGTSLSHQVSSLRVVDEAGAHLMAKARVVLKGPQTFDEGDPVEVMWGFHGSMARSFMYVHRVDDVGSRHFRGDALSLTLVGATWPLKSGRHRVIRHHRASQILRSIAQDHGLSSSFSAVDRTFDNFVSRTSDWEGLRDLAKRTGGLLRAEGATIRIIDMSEGLDRLGGAPVFSVDTVRISDVTTTARKNDSRRRVASTMHPSTKSVTTLEDATVFDPADLSLTDHAPRVGDPAELLQDLRAERLSERFRERATIGSMVGAARLRPGEVVGFRNMTKNKDGYWTVTKADHRLSEDTFTTSLELGRSTAHPRTATDASDRLTPPSLPGASGVRLRQNRWVAT